MAIGGMAMRNELLINVTPHETRVGIVENGLLQEVLIERASCRGLVGNIYKGKVSRVLPGMQAAFIEIGLARTAFLHISDIINEKESDNLFITDVLRDGQELLVQVIKDPLGSKGARLTTHISIPARYLVYLPYSEHIGISQKIEKEEERTRLREIVINENAEYGKGGYIVRTVAEGIDHIAIRADIKFLNKLWEAINEKMKSSAPGSLVHEDLALVMRMMRDLVGSNIDQVLIDSNYTYQKVIHFAEKFIPELVPRIDYYTGERPIFELYNIEDELKKALARKVHLKSGGYLVIDQTEAMTTIDVNTGAFVGHRNLEETIFKTNLEAATAIVRQLRLRNLGGIIIIDFIDMKEAENRRQVLRALEKSLASDPAKTCITELSSLGLVEMTRKRIRESLEHMLCEPCPLCEGRGSIKTSETVCFEIFREILREARQYESEKILVLASEIVVEHMVNEESSGVAELEEFIGRAIRFQVEVSYMQEQYDVVPI